VSTSARVAAQAKINLFLRILAREASGYHSLETLFQRIDLADQVRVRVGGSGRSLDCAGPAMPAAGLGPTERNLAYRAALAYAEATGWPDGFAIEVEKHIPAGAGLGGGSADAGAVLRALDALSPRPVGEVRLLELATPLGADVPFLTSTSVLSLAWGRGERMLALPALPARDVVVVIPDAAVSTADAYGWLAEARGNQGPAAAQLLASELCNWDAVARLAHNDFEPVLQARFPVIGEWVGRLRGAGAAVAMLSGSGSAIFGLVEVDGVTRVPEFPEPRRAPRVELTQTAASVAPVTLE
jgi:4-diphosphocytidyl-2-C-methyl-D-erythritol kinase